MDAYGFVRVSLFLSVGHCKRNRHSHDEHEERLNQIPEMQAVPFVMRQLCAKELGYPVVDRMDVTIQSRTFSDQQEHRESPEKID